MHVLQALPLDDAHRVVGLPVGQRAEIVDGDDVRMLELRGDAALAHEAPRDRGLRVDAELQRLQRDDAADLAIARAHDLADAAGAERVAELVSTLAELGGCAPGLVRVGHAVVERLEVARSGVRSLDGSGVALAAELPSGSARARRAAPREDAGEELTRRLGAAERPATRHVPKRFGRDAGRARTAASAIARASRVCASFSLDCPCSRKSARGRLRFMLALIRENDDVPPSAERGGHVEIRSAQRAERSEPFRRRRTRLKLEP